MVRKFKEYLISEKVGAPEPKFDKQKVIYNGDGKSYLASQPEYDKDAEMWMYKLDGDKDTIHNVYEDEIKSIIQKKPVVRKAKKVVSKVIDHSKLVKKYDKLDEIKDLILELGDENSNIKVDSGWSILTSIDGENDIDITLNKKTLEGQNFNTYIDKYYKNILQRQDTGQLPKIVECRIISLEPDDDDYDGPDYQVFHRDRDDGDYLEVEQEYDGEEVLSNKNINLRKSNLDRELSDKKRRFSRIQSKIDHLKSLFDLFQRILKAYPDVDIWDQRYDDIYEFVIMPKV